MEIKTIVRYQIHLLHLPMYKNSADKNTTKKEL